MAAQNGHLEVARLLFDRGAHINVMKEVAFTKSTSARNRRYS